jgi:monothiol glutaredoxin
MSQPSTDNAGVPERIRGLIDSHPVLLFMKGDRGAPQCGFSAQLVRILDSLLPEYGTFDVLSDPAVREGIKVFSQWPTIPQLYVRGEFLGGCDIVTDMHASGELFEALGLEAPPDKTPTLTITAAAAEALRRALEQSGGGELHIGVDARFANQLSVGPGAPGEIAVESNGIKVWMDRASAARADGATIDVIDTPQGLGFRIDNPNASTGQVEELAAAELRRWREEGRRFEFLDARTPEERAVASIDGAVLLTPEEAARLERLPKDTPMVFHCHHGGRSRAAAEHFASLGFSRLFNLTGGIEAWSLEVDSSVPRY